MQITIKILGLLLMGGIFLSAKAQRPEPQKQSYYGGVFTPKGNLKALVVLVSFKDGCSTNPNFKNAEMEHAEWPMTQGGQLPPLVDPLTGDCPKFMFNREEHFFSHWDSVFYNDSKLFYMMSGGQFKLMIDVFKDSNNLPRVIEIDPEGGRDWSHMNKKALEEMKKIAPNFDWSPYDQRKNRPNFDFDNSINPQPDQVVDYIIFLYRYRPEWSQQPAPGMNRWSGSGGGFASPSGIQMETYNGYRFSEGFTMMFGSGVFIHELAHTLFNAPHLWGANSTVGHYFYRPTVGWGPTSTIPLFRCFTAWERWYMGWLPKLVDIKGPESLKKGNRFYLDDFISTGQSIRIQIPFSNNQYLWLENHAKQHPYDEHPWAGYIIGGDTVGYTPAGVYAYVEAIAPEHSKIIQALSDATNGLKLLNAAGNYDYSYLKEAPKLNAWQNKMYSFKREAANPLAGTNPYYFFRADFDGDGIIAHDINYNAARNEGEPIFSEEVSGGEYKNLYQNFGLYDVQKMGDYTRLPCFGPGDLLDMGTNPTITNYPKYQAATNSMEPIYLSGLSVRFRNASNSENPKRVEVEVNYGQTALNQDVRWTGNIILPNISGDSTPDLLLKSRKELLLERSGTAHRHTLSKDGQFTNPTYFKISADAHLMLEKRAVLIIGKDASLEFEKGAQLSISKKARIIVKEGGSLLLNGTELKLARGSKLLVEGNLNK